MLCWSITETGIYGTILNVVAICSCLVVSLLDRTLGSQIVLVILLVLLDMAIIGIV